MENNYEKQVYHARDLFLKYDQTVMAEKFHLEQDAEYLYVKLLNRRYRIARVSGAVEAEKSEVGMAETQEYRKTQEYRSMKPEEPEGADREAESSEYECWELCMDYQIVMIIYDILCYSKETPSLSGDWCPLQSLQITMSSPSPERLFRSVALSFSGRAAELRQACQRLGGERQAVPASADVCYKINIFPFFPVIFQFWDGDDEFEPKIMVLWDRRSLDFMHFETLYYAMNHFLNTMQEQAAE